MEDRDSSGGWSHSCHHEPNPKRRTKTNKEEALTLNEDRISALPDSLLIHILSFLPARPMIRTGTLSKRWQHLWTFVPNLVFTRSLIGLRHNHQKMFINQTLIQSCTSKINKFSIHLEYDISDESDVNSWVRYATRRNVEDLYLNLSPLSPDAEEYYNLPHHLFTCSSITSLTLVSCVVEPRGLVSWRLIKSLKFAGAQLTNEAIEKVVSGCPVLEILDLYFYDGFNCLKINSLTLRELILDQFWDDFDEEKDDGLLVISAPNLSFLKISGVFYTRNIRLEDVTSLAFADLSFQLLNRRNTGDDFEKYRNMVLELLGKLRQVEELKLGTWCVQVLSILELKVICTPMLKCKYLTLDVSILKGDLPGIVKLLEISPYLETLNISPETFFPAESVCGVLMLDMTRLLRLSFAAFV